MTIDLNCDLGEAFGVWPMGDDAALLGLVSSANVACGFHAGDPSTMRRTCLEAARRGVVVGAHVGYRDLAGFGRRFLDVEPSELTDEVVYQVGALQAVAAAAGTAVRYVKPHGALYTAIARHDAQARAVVAAVNAVDPGLPLVVLPGGVAERVAREAGLRTVGEAFVDRGYRADGSLVPRGAPGALVTDHAVAAARAARLAEDGTVEADDGTVVRLDVETLCLHGDTPGAVGSATAVRAALEARGIAVEPFVR
ncbi:LamB/YcsF family protein [Actinotalea ferrariae]|uniref:LamB/YcsF family protein n=1 Tax=Actinotalea ferrariae TaxID=1386098 RepID=UPI001C8B5361|nr:5-oxoprolinase subunit PxpA [Actinotalea ferrariae]MBX9244226.1 LamB/YcsF family protein [Actinotalea ferrariae]